MNPFDRLLDYWESRGISRRMITDEEVLENARPLTSAILSLSPYRRPDLEDHELERQGARINP